jgi:hypothetical protein
MRKVLRVLIYGACRALASAGFDGPVVPWGTITAQAPRRGFVAVVAMALKPAVSAYART